MKPARSLTAHPPGIRPVATSYSTLNAFLLFVVGLSLAGSGFASLRPSFLGLSVHPYLMVVGAFFPILAITRLHLIPPRHLLELLAFAGFYFATTIPGGTDAGEGIKIFAAVATILTMAILVRTWEDFVAGTLGMCVAVGILAVRGLEADAAPGQGVQAMEQANRNAYSLYALPAILLGTYVLVRGRPDPLLTKLAIAASVLASSLAICLNLNRSGWLGLGVIAILIVRRKSLKAAVLLAVIGLCLIALILILFSSSTGALQTRVATTQEGLESDKLRWKLITMSAETAIENPLLGVSPQNLPRLLAARLGYRGEVLPHNVYAQIAAGSGLVALFLLFLVGYRFWGWNPTARMPVRTQMAFRETQSLMRDVLILWGVRGLFTHEIIYSPGFCMAIGLVWGLQISVLPRIRPATSMYRPSEHGSY